MKKLFPVALFCLFGVAALAGDLDQRQPQVLVLTEQQGGLVLEEMRALLAGTQSILAGLAKDDMVGVAHSARSLGMAMRDKSENSLKGALPDGFMQLGTSVHQDFDRIAADAELLKDPKHTLRQLSESMATCVACHALYQIRMTKISQETMTKP